VYVQQSSLSRGVSAKQTVPEETNTTSTGRDAMPKLLSRMTVVSQLEGTNPMGATLVNVRHSSTAHTYLPCDG
jgi:hypothetical protein